MNRRVMMGKYRMWKEYHFGMGSRRDSKIVKKNEIQYVQRQRGFEIIHRRYSLYWLTESWMEL